MKPSLRMAVIGGGFIGRCHALAAAAAGRVFADLKLRPEPHVLCDIDASRSAGLAESTGFARHTTNWREAVEACDAVVIAVPSREHVAIALHAIALGKPVLCEKPVGLSSAEAERIADAAEAAGVPNAVGFTYVRAPLVQYARKILDSGQLGAPVHFAGRHAEGYLADPDLPFTWRLDAAVAGRCGALGDLGCHILAVARFLCGPVASLVGMATTVHPRRRDPASGSARSVENDDHAAALLRFASGVPGVLETSRVAHGRQLDLSFDLVCERGALRFDAERTNELALYVDEGRPEQAGFRRILLGASHPDYAAFLPASGHGLGFNDLKTIEMRDFVQAIAEGRNAQPDLREAVRIARICEAILDSSASGRWVHDVEHGP